MSLKNDEQSKPKPQPTTTKKEEENFSDNSEIKDLLSCEVIDFSKLQDLIFQGIERKDSKYRPVVWKLLLGYLPLASNKWEVHLENERKKYESLTDKFISERQRQFSFSKQDTVVKMRNEKYHEVNVSLSHLTGVMSKKMSTKQEEEKLKLEQKLKNVEIQILKDIGRTKLLTDFLENETDEKLQHQVNRSIFNLLFLYSRTSFTGYVQGMNDILVPLYFVFFNDPDPEQRKWAEHDTYYCFSLLLKELSDLFCRDLDSSLSGIQSRSKKVSKIVGAYRPLVSDKLAENDIEPDFYLVPWISAIFSQLFPFESLVCIWDFMFADKGHFKFINYICASMVVSLSEQIIGSDFLMLMNILQNFPKDYSVKLLIAKAKQIQIFMKNQKKAKKGSQKEKQKKIKQRQLKKENKIKKDLQVKFLKEKKSEEKRIQIEEKEKQKLLSEQKLLTFQLSPSKKKTRNTKILTKEQQKIEKRERRLKKKRDTKIKKEKLKREKESRIQQKKLLKQQKLIEKQKKKEQREREKHERELKKKREQAMKNVSSDPKYSKSRKSRKNRK
ncbi:tbc1 domain family member 13-like [Anaeramoeba flamelloides]|uniref:Tbc1 domain family member 13-like n=1 Tax=Anaeramoeba flamelloides TaxID=1746091 RepID=A0AAV7YK66_9EUKA|nr:tbc1 domain family member 13-like [Anaeramoeba flamelloides]